MPGSAVNPSDPAISGALLTLPLNRTWDLFGQGDRRPSRSHRRTASAGRVPGGARHVDELWRERLHSPIHRAVIDLDPAFGQQLLDIAVGQPVTQTPAHATAIARRIAQPAFAAKTCSRALLGSVT